MRSKSTGIQLIKDPLINLLWKGIIEGSKQHIIVVIEKEEAVVAINVVVEGAAVGDKSGVQ